MQLTDSNARNEGGYRPASGNGLPGADPLGFDKVLNGLMTVLDAERQALQKAAPGDFGALTRQKLQLLMQLDRLATASRPARLSAPVGDKLAEARRRLDENARLLKHRMEAIREIAELISEEIRDAESDGTYSITGNARGGRR